MMYAVKLWPATGKCIKNVDEAVELAEDIVSDTNGTLNEVVCFSAVYSTGKRC